MNLHKVSRWILAATSLIVAAGIACGGAGDQSGDTRGTTHSRLLSVRSECDVNAGACAAVLGDREVTLDIAPKPVKAMEDLRFTLTLTGELPEHPPFVDLNMVAMDMGPNRVDLKKLGDGSYTGTGVIVRCASGKRTWKAVVTIPGVGEAEFVFDVVY